MKILLSIKPEYSQAIMDGRKKVEFRKTKIRPNIQDGLVYMTRTTKKVVASIKIKEIDSGTPQEMWDKYHTVGGIDEQSYFDYYSGKGVAYVICIDSVKVLDEAEQYKPAHVPQSFCYIE